MKKSSASNRGEGNAEAAARFNKAESQFVASDRGKKRIRAGTRVQPGEQSQLDEAEQRARARSKGIPL
jgi:hypothetical protein